jgi:methionine synthase I (cobalamin-dependent)
MPRVDIVPVTELTRRSGRGSSQSYLRAIDEAKSNLRRLLEAGPDKALLLTLEDNETENTIKNRYKRAAKELGITISFSRQGVRERNGQTEASVIAVMLK